MKKEYYGVVTFWKYGVFLLKIEKLAGKSRSRFMSGHFSAADPQNSQAVPDEIDVYPFIE